MFTPHKEAIMPDESGAVWIPTNNYMSRNGFAPKFVICHGTAGFTNARDVGTYFQGADVSAHYVVGPDGTIVQCVEEQWAAWANGPIENGADSWWWAYGNGNYPTISIEHVKPHTDNSDQLTSAQKAASFRLIDHICKRHGIRRALANANGGITGHYSLDPVNRSRCPGPYPWDELISYLNNGGQDSDMLSASDNFSKTYFETGDNEWKCKTNGVRLGDNFLKYYQAINGAPRLPITAVHSTKTAKGTIYWQRFESGIMVSDPKGYLDAPSMPNNNGCYMLKENSDLARQLLSQDLIDKISALQKQVDTLNQQLSAAQNANVDALQQQITDLTKQIADLKTQLSVQTSKLAQIADLAK
jgi:N-acetyl-anhydromuramyl-L-alanine amidase AmpD